MLNETMYGYGAESSKIREIFSYANERKALIGEDKVFDFSLGNPSVPAPPAVRASIERSLALPPEQLHGYTPAPGLPEARQAVADSLNRRFGCAYSAADVFMTVGAAASVSCALHAVVSPGEEVVVMIGFDIDVVLYRSVESHPLTFNRRMFVRHGSDFARTDIPFREQLFKRSVSDRFHNCAEQNRIIKKFGSRWRTFFSELQLNRRNIIGVGDQFVQIVIIQDPFVIVY